MDQLKSILESVIKQLYGLQFEVNFYRPNYEFGDYATNCSFVISEYVKQTPLEVATAIKQKIDSLDNPIISRTEVLNNFLNIRLNDQILIENINQRMNYGLRNQKIVIEYSDPNPFKMLHAGHLYTSIVGDSIANMFNYVGAKVYRVNFGGDIGLHVAKNIWSMIRYLGGENPDKLSLILKNQRQKWMNERYLEGNEAFLNNPQYKDEIKQINKRIYKFVLSNDYNSDLAKLFLITREWSYQYLRDFYAKLNITFDKYYPESSVTQLGLRTVQEHTPDPYTESNGAIIFDGQKYNLKTYVYITSDGLPTYSAKDVGLMIKKWEDYGFDQSFIITAHDQVDYLKNVLKSIEQFRPDLAQKTKHLTNGLVKLSSGQKMSSRSGNALSAEEVLEYAISEEQKISKVVDPKIYISAIKYSFLKQKMGGDIIYNPSEVVAMEGNSGPYIQYSFVRAKKIVESSPLSEDEKPIFPLDKEERYLVYRITEFGEILQKSLEGLSTHHICTYLYELSQSFNSFYESSPIIKSDRKKTRIFILKEYINVVGYCFKILGLEEINSM